MLLEQRALPSNVSNSIVVELWEGLIHIKAIRLTTREAASQAVQGTVGLLSCVILLSLLGYLFSHVLYVGHGARKERAQTLKRFLATDMGVYLVMLLISDLGMSIAAIVDIPWSRTFLISHTPLCEFQGIANQLGVFAAAFWNLCLAFQTFLLLFIRYTPPSWAKWVVVPFGWTFAVLMTILGPIMNKSPYAFYGPNSAGCWLTIGSSNYKAWLLTAAYFAISCLVIMAVIYIILFLSLSGALEKITGRMNSSTGRGSSSNPSRTSTAIPSSVTRGRQVRSVARKMLWFPVSYATLSCLTVFSAGFVVASCAIFSLPLVVCTLLAAKGKILDHEIYIASNILFVLVLPMSPSSPSPADTSSPLPPPLPPPATVASP
ncbi:hypothetical protein BDY24DRAFT_370115 [Mrakia frigida]|uniref:uncharacterized protein n=1 Tax=Mrakia frigida TaxID=29902 RepID=UPI003FCBF114